MEYRTILRKRGIGAAVLFGAFATVGCGGVSANTPPPATAARASDVDDVSAGLMEHHRHHHHGGVTLMIALSLDTLGVSPGQRTAVEKIRSDLHARMEPARAAEQQLVTTLADGLAAANLDDASADALNELHAVLTPPERAALVDKVEAHWAVWQKANAEQTDPRNPERGQLAMLATDLGLTRNQVDKIRAGLGEGMKAMPRVDLQEIATHLRAFGDAFRSDKFDARVLTTANGANAHLAGWGAARLAHFIEAVSPVLTPDQRARFAQRLREHAAHTPSNGGNQ
jgi:Spy/CpxP family protein refolding chaperone